MLSALVQELGHLSEWAESEYDEHVDVELPTAEQLAVVLAAIRDCRADLAALYGKVESGLMSMAGEKRFTVEHLGEVEIRKSTKRTGWDNDALTAVVVARALDERIVNEQTGEYEPPQYAVARVLSECARPSWRVTPLRARGIQVDEYCSEDPGHYSVMLPPRKP